MAEVDMIPREYRDGVRVRRTLRVAGAALAAVLLLGAAGGMGLRWRAATLAREVGALEASAAQSERDADRRAALAAEQARRRQTGAVLLAVRRQGELAALARGLDAALSDQVWLTELKVERDIQAAGPGNPAAAADGAVQLEAGGGQVWHMLSSVQLAGQAENYGAVTAFLAALGRQPGMKSLKLVSSSAAEDGQVVDFRATGTLIQPQARP